MERLLRNIYRLSSFLLLLSSFISAFFMEWRFPFSILIGGIIGLGNLRGIVISVSRIFNIEKKDMGDNQIKVIQPQRAQAKMLILGIFRLLIIFSVLLILIILNTINIYGFLIGFSIVFLVLIKEGISESKRQQRQD